MKTRLLFFIFFGTFISVSSQLSNEIIWATGTFYPKTIKGINPSKDGNYYTSIEQDDSKTEIVKYDYKSNKKVATLFSNTYFNKFGLPQVTEKKVNLLKMPMHIKRILKASLQTIFQSGPSRSE